MPARRFEPAGGGGNRGRSPRVFLAAVGEEPSHTIGAVSHARSSDRGLITFELIGDNLCPFAGSARQDDPRALHLNQGSVWLRAI